VPPFTLAKDTARSTKPPPLVLLYEFGRWSRQFLIEFCPSAAIFFPFSVSTAPPYFPRQWMCASIFPFPPLVAGPHRRCLRPQEPLPESERRSSSAAEPPHRGRLSPVIARASASCAPHWLDRPCCLGHWARPNPKVMGRELAHHCATIFEFIFFSLIILEISASF
jgi:hypothetical protein